MGKKHKTFLRDIKNKLKQPDATFTCWKTQHLKMLIFLKLTFRFNEISIKIQVGLYVCLSVCVFV